MTKAIQALEVTAMVDNIVGVRAVKYGALFHSLWVLKATPIDVQYILIQELIFYVFGLGHKAAEATKIICFQNSNQVVQEILFGLLEIPWSGKIRLTKKSEFWCCTLSHKISSIGFHGISTIEVYLMPNLPHTYISKI